MPEGSPPNAFTPPMLIRKLSSITSPLKFATWNLQQPNKLDNRTQILPNAATTGALIENYSKQGARRLDFTAGVSHGDDIPTVKKVLQERITVRFDEENITISFPQSGVHMIKSD